MALKSILFVCLGNICRSPAADGVFRVVAARRGLDIEIDSAGMGGWHIGQLPDSRMRACGRRHGYTFDHRARQVSVADFGHYDLIVGMDNQNMKDLTNLAPDETAKAKVVCMADFMRNHPGRTTVPDPYYGDDSDFELALELIEDAAEGLADAICNGEF